MRTAIPLLLACLAAACATTSGGGWRGEGAQPFDGARAQCEADASDQPAGAARTAAFEACMAEQGWHRD